MTYRPGDFGFRPILEEYQPKLADLRPWLHKNGLQQQVVYFYGGFRDAAGTRSALERKFVGPMTAGLWLMSDADGSQRLDPGTVRSTRGEVRRHFGDDVQSYSDQLMARLGEELAPVGEQGLDLQLRDDGFTWREGELMELEGTLVGPGLQIHCPMLDEAFLYFSHAYRVAGTVRGTEVEGFIWMDHGYWPHGREWKEFRIFNELQVGWEVFGNAHADGSLEWGHLCRGTQGFTFGAIFDESGLVTASTDMTVAADLDDDEYVERARFDLGDQVWEWTGPAKGQLRQFSNARWGGYRAQVGTTVRRGDDRALTDDFTWLECFAGRIRDEKLPPTSQLG